MKVEKDVKELLAEYAVQDQKQPENVDLEKTYVAYKKLSDTTQGECCCGSLGALCCCGL